MWISWGLLWCFYQLFVLSFWRHPLVTNWWANTWFSLSKFSVWGELFLKKKQIKLGCLSGCMKVIHTVCVKHTTRLLQWFHTLWVQVGSEAWARRHGINVLLDHISHCSKSPAGHGHRANTFMSHYAFMKGACGVVIETGLGANPAGKLREDTRTVSLQGNQ